MGDERIRRGRVGEDGVGEEDWDRAEHRDETVDLDEAEDMEGDDDDC